VNKTECFGNFDYKIEGYNFMTFIQGQKDLALIFKFALLLQLQGELQGLQVHVVVHPPAKVKGKVSRNKLCTH
jgi:hypothetical protein